MTAPVHHPTQVRHGLAHWLRSWSLLLRWQLLGLRTVIPLLVLVQGVIGVGAVVAVRIWFDAPPPAAGAFVTTGAATLTLVMVGVVALPQMVAEQRLRGTYDYQWSLPVPRSCSTAAGLTVNLAIAAPAVVATVAAGVVTYDLDLAVSPSVIVAVLLTSATAGLVGSALAHGVGNPRLVSIVSQVLIFVIFGFSPILYPEANLPEWLSTIHDWFPFSAMASVVRAGLTHGLVQELPRAYLVLITWLTGGMVVTALSIGRRR